MEARTFPGSLTSGKMEMRSLKNEKVKIVIEKFKSREI
jgi:hypothetical protein